MTGSEASRMDGQGVVEQLARWVLAVRTDDLTPAVRDQARLLLLDTIGCGFAALDEPSACALLAVVEGSGGTPQCTVIGRAHRTSAANATLANGALVRILDFNDYVNAKAGDLGGHPSDNIPVALAAQNGVQAALLAERGITGPLDLFENPRGMRAVFSKGDAAADLTAPLPAESAIMAAN